MKLTTQTIKIDMVDCDGTEFRIQALNGRTYLSISDEQLVFEGKSELQKFIKMLSELADNEAIDSYDNLIPERPVSYVNSI